MNDKDEFDYIYRLGPVASESGPVGIYLILADDNPDPVLADTDAEAMAQIAEVRKERTIYCHPDLEEAGNTQGFESRPLDHDRSHDLAMFVMEMVISEAIEEIDHEGVLHQFGQSCGKFWRNRPWERQYARSVVSLDFDGVLSGTFEGWVMGSAGDMKGMVLYTESGSVQRLMEAVAEGNTTQIARIDSIGVNLVTEPEFAQKPFQEVFGLPRIPIPTRSQDGQRVPMESAEMMALSAALQAAAVLSDSGSGSRASVQVEDRKVTALLRPGR